MTGPATFARLRAADWVAMALALALMFVLATDWYGTKLGDLARQRANETQNAAPGESGDVNRAVNQNARAIADSQERNAWQADGAIDGVILVVCLATVAAALGAGFLRAAGRRFEPPWTPSGVAAVLAVLGALLVTYRIIQQPGYDPATVVKAGAPLAIATLALIALAGSRSLRAEVAGNAFREPRPAPTPRPAAEAPAPVDRDAS